MDALLCIFIDFYFFAVKIFLSARTIFRLLSYNTFNEFFKKATGFTPYPYQERLAEMKDIPDILSIPTGLGKTEAAILSIYLWSRYFDHRPTPRNLVYCLPMRVLVEQTVERVRSWLDNLDLVNKPKIIVLMGGNKDEEHLMHPEGNYIIIGTQDMLLSRALNRGYGMSQFQWPREFGLLNNDCMWIIDEIQLMHNGLATSTQLDAFRNKMGTFGSHKTIWMSATVNPQWLNTVDFDIDNKKIFNLSEEDSKNELLLKRNNAEKILSYLDVNTKDDAYPKDEVQKIRDVHKKDTISLVIVNTVKRAQSIFRELKKLNDCNVILVHSRFREQDRKRMNQMISKLPKDADAIIVSTQTIEAGVDISATTLVTEIAPWSSMIQRFGRCNRTGDNDNSIIHIIRIDKKQYPPYEEKDMMEAEKIIDEKIGTSVSPNSLPSPKNNIMHDSVIRMPDIIGLFDTVSDLSGNHTDVSQYVRSIEDSQDVSVFWREFDDRSEIKNVRSEEMCSVPISDIRNFKKEKDVYAYDFLDGKWRKASFVYPGQTLLIHSSHGGYDQKIGWSVRESDTVKPIESDANKEQDGFEDSYGEDQQSGINKWVTLNDHTVHVINETETITEHIDYLNPFKEILQIVAKYHDVGKGHHVFQNTMTKNTRSEDDISKNEFWAKRRGNHKHERSDFRHEALSALVFLKMNHDHQYADIIAYLIACHHGKVRIAMRSMPRKRSSVNTNNQFLLGMNMNEDEEVPVFFSSKCKKSIHSKEKLIEENIEEKIMINTDIATVGMDVDKHSWLHMTLSLLEKYGLFKLAFLESIIRAADTRASVKENKS